MDIQYIYVVGVDPFRGQEDNTPSTCEIFVKLPNLEMVTLKSFNILRDIVCRQTEEELIASYKGRNV